MKNILVFFIVLYSCVFVFAQDWVVQPLPPKPIPPVQSQNPIKPALPKTTAEPEGRCNPWEIELNTVIPFISVDGRPCISKDLDESAQGTTVSNAFPRLMAWLARILMTVILVGAFVAILVGGLMMASAGFTGKYADGKSLIIKVIGGLALIGISGAILNAVNPNFFKTNSHIESIKVKV